MFTFKLNFFICCCVVSNSSITALRVVSLSISNMLTHHRIIRHHDGTKFDKKLKLENSNFSRIPEE